MSLASDDPEHVVIVPGCHFTPTASAGSATAVSGNKVEGDFAQEGEIAGGGAVAHAAVVLAAGDVERPMQRVLDAPVPMDHPDQDGEIVAAAGEQDLTPYRPLETSEHILRASLSARTKASHPARRAEHIKSK